MPLITVEMFEGRTIEQKKKLVEGITSVLANIGVPADHLHIIIKDVAKHNWATGGRLASEESRQS